ncbi:MAG: family acetyltransferase [Frankiales bacterium]|nr:family acetyltransferase [Frankiales bacterium]
MDVRGLQERAARAQPAPVEERRGGDLLRAAHDPATWWVGASLLHGTGPLPARLDAVQDLCRRHGAPPCVQVCPACPPGLDEALATRGWSRSVDVELLVADAATVPAPGTDVVVAAGRAEVRVGGAAVATGRVVVEDGWGGVFGMRTLAGARRRGAAAAVLGGLAVWAVEHGARRLYLQVTADNAPACALYARAGFSRAATYHYRTAPPG